MVKVNYYTKLIEFSQKTQKVMFLFKRLPTQQQLEVFEKQQAEPQPRRQMSMSGMSINNIFHMFEEPEPELELNWDKVRVVVTKEQAHKAKLKIGDVVQLDIPEEHSDIQILSEGS